MTLGTGCDMLVHMTKQPVRTEPKPGAIVRLQEQVSVKVAQRLEAARPLPRSA